MRYLLGPAFFLALLTLMAASAAEPPLTRQDLPRFPPVPARVAGHTFQVKPGFHLELAACEPNIASPVALSFDEDGRMFVVEMIDYSERRDEVPHLGRIRLLEDQDGDGFYEKSTVYATNLAWPTAVFCYDGGVFVAATPDILYLKDTNHDGKADTREVVFTGFAEGLDRINVQAMLNSFIWGLDNRIHGATSGNGGRVRSLLHPESKPLDLHGRDFVIEPRAMVMTSEAGGGQHGLSFDDTGRRFACNNSDHIRLFMYDDVYAARNPFYTMPGPLVSIAVDGPAAEVYRISPEEPWRQIRTRWRVAGLVPGPVEGGGRASGYFTGATGTTIYRGDAFPESYRGNAFIADCGGNLIHRKVLLQDGVGLRAQRADDEQKVEFIASSDTWFRPVQFANAPDGTLYVIDMYREIIEHPWSLPDSIKRLVDLNSGNERGRIYRIAPDGYRLRPGPHLGKASTAELVTCLTNRNAWHRETASRLLYERRDAAAIPLLLELFKASDSWLGRLQALHALDGQNALTEAVVRRALEDPNAAVREHAVKFAERFIQDGTISKASLARLLEMTEDQSIRVRYQLAFTLGEVPVDLKAQPLARLTQTDPRSSWMRAAVLSSLGTGARQVFAALTQKPDFYRSEAGQTFLKELVRTIGWKKDSEGNVLVLDFIASKAEPGFKYELLSALGEGLERGGGQLRELGPKATSLVEEASKMIQESQGDLAQQVSAIRLLGLTTFAESGGLLLSILTDTHPSELQNAALDSLRQYSDPELAPALLQRWSTLSPRLRAGVVSALLERPKRTVVLLKAIENGAVPVEALTTAQAHLLRTHSNPAITELARQTLGPEAKVDRQGIVQKFLPALGLQGNAEPGQKIYLDRCSSCHRLDGQGHSLGPDFVTVKNSGKEKLLINMLDPNREVRPDYISYAIETDDGESFVGLIANETPTSLTVKQAYGKEDVLLRARIRTMRSQGLSVMPEGLETGLTLQDVADLLECIEEARP